MRRAVLIVVAAVVFLAVSGFLARWLSVEGRERGDVRELLEAQAAGDAEAMLEVLDPSCRASARCRQTVAANARRLQRSGEVKIIAYESDTARALGTATGETRVAWKVVGRGLPVVQCVLVHRGGSAVSDRSVTLLRISSAIGNESSC